MDIQRIKDDLIRLGLEDNINLALLMYLSATARKTPYKISILVSGPAGLGKSHLAKRVLELFPQEDIISSSRMTPAYLVRQGDLRDKVLFIYEKFEDPQFAQYIRELITEGEVNYFTAVGEHKLIGPTTLIETTVDSEIFGIENRSRCFVVGANMSYEARESILHKQKLLRTTQGFQFQKLLKSLQNEHREFQRSLNLNLQVVIPFAESIKLCANSYHIPRILERVLNLISTIAYLHQADCGKPKEIDGISYVEANRDDFNEAKQILIGAPIEEDDVILPRADIEFIEALRKNRPALSNNKTFSRNQLTEVLSQETQFKSYKVITKHLNTLTTYGFIDELPTRGLKNKVEYAFSKDFPISSAESFANNCYASLSLE